MGLNLLKYFIHDRRDLSPAYVRKCEKFLKGLKPSSSQAGGPAHKESGFKPSSSQALKQQGPGFPDSCNNLFDREVE